MNDEQLKTLADLQGLLKGTVMMDFVVAGDERYGFIARTVKRFGYGRLKRSGAIGVSMNSLSAAVPLAPTFSATPFKPSSEASP